MKLLPDNKVPKLGAPGESYRENQLLHQVNYLFFLINLKCLLESYTFQYWRLKTKLEEFHDISVHFRDGGKPKNLWERGSLVGIIWPSQSFG